MNKTFLRLLAVAAIAALSASCLLLPNPEGDEPGWRTVPEPGGTPASSEFRETVPFEAGGTLSLENDYGDVAIAGWDRNEIEVVARAATVETQPQSAARQFRIRKVTPEVEIRETGQGLLVRTPTYEGTGEAPAVDYDIKVPRDVVLTGIRISEGSLTIGDVFGRIEASVDQGDFSVANFSGSLKAIVGTGNADIEVLDLREGDEITVTSRSGDILLRLEPNAVAVVEANAPHGGVTSDFDLGVQLPAPTVKGWIGQGGPTVILMASNGRVRIIRTAGGGN